MKKNPLFPRPMGLSTDAIRPLVEKVLGSHQSRRQLMLIGLASATLVVSSCARSPVPASTPVASTPVASTPAPPVSVTSATPSPSVAKPTPNARPSKPIKKPRITERDPLAQPPSDVHPRPSTVYGMPRRSRD